MPVPVDAGRGKEQRANEWLLLLRRIRHFDDGSKFFVQDENAELRDGWQSGRAQTGVVESTAQICASVLVEAWRRAVVRTHEHLRSGTETETDRADSGQRARVSERDANQLAMSTPTTTPSHQPTMIIDCESAALCVSLTLT